MTCNFAVIFTYLWVQTAGNLDDAMNDILLRLGSVQQSAEQHREDEPHVLILSLPLHNPNLL